MSTTGAKYPTLGETVSEAPWSDDTWVNPTRIYADDTLYAAVTTTAFDAGDQTYVLKATGFNFNSIPNDATILGVQCVVKAWYANAAVSIDLLQLLDGSVAKNKVGTNMCAVPVALTNTVNAVGVSTGSASSTWENALTPAWVKNSNFGVAIGCLAGGTGNSNNDVYVDCVTLEITYSEPTRVIQLDQTCAAVKTAVGDHLDLTFVTAPTAGSLVAVGISQWNTPVGITSVADNQGNEYSLAVSKAYSTSKVYIYYALNIISSGTFTITITFPLGYDSSAGAASFINVHPTSQHVASGSNSGTGTAISSNIVTYSKEALYFAICEVESNVINTTPDWSEVFSDEVGNDSPISGVYRIDTTGDVQATWTCTSIAWGSAIAAFSVKDSTYINKINSVLVNNISEVANVSLSSIKSVSTVINQ